MPLTLSTPFTPTGDQPTAIDALTMWVREGAPQLTLLGVTGSGKTYTMANVISRTQAPTLIISPNKTLAAQLYGEFKEFFPTAAVHYFVSYYDYYQPEAYVPQTDTYIEKEAMVNEEIDRLRHASTQSLLTRSDVIIVASVSCIYGLGSPEEYGRVRLTLRRGDHSSQQKLLRTLVDLQFQRNDVAFERGVFRVKGDTIEIRPAASDRDWIRIERFGDAIERITARDIDGTQGELAEVTLFPATHYVAPPEQFAGALAGIRAELESQLAALRAADKLVEAARLEQRTRYDLQMLEETGYVHGIENYSRFFDGRAAGEPPFTLIDFYNYAYGSERTREQTRTERKLRSDRPEGEADRVSVGTGEVLRGVYPERSRWAQDDAHTEGLASPDRNRGDRSPAARGWLCFVDESHVTVPQLRGMYAGDQSRKRTLVEYGFRIPSCVDNRPLRFEEFTARVPQTVYVSATPSEYEIDRSRVDGERRVAEQLIRPTGLLDPDVEVRSSEGQIPNLITEITARAAKGQRTLVTVLTKRMAEDLAEHLSERGIRAFHIHADVETFERIEILDDLRRGRYDCIVGINLLREGLDLPEVTLVAILDADNEGFLRSTTALVQTMGRAARHVDGHAILYADRETEAMRIAIAEVRRRRATQEAYNHDHGITPRSIEKAIRGRGPMVVKNDAETRVPPRRPHRGRTRR